MDINSYINNDIIFDSKASAVPYNKVYPLSRTDFIRGQGSKVVECSAKRWFPY